MKRLCLFTFLILAGSPAWALSDVDRAVIWTRCWEAVRTHYVGFDAPKAAAWDAGFEPNLRDLTSAGSDTEFWRMLRMRIASLGDGRTTLQTPNGLPRVYDTVPIRFVLAEDKVLVKQLGASAEVQNSGIKIGDELRTVDHIPVLRHLRDECLPHVSGSTESGRLAEAVWRVLIGEADSQVHLVLNRPNGEEYSVNLRRNSGLDGEHFRDLSKIEGRFVRKFPGDILYMEIGQRLTANAEQGILDQLAANPKTDHLILDLRDTKFGSVPMRVLKTLALFPLPMGAYRETDWAIKPSYTEPNLIGLKREWGEVKSSMIDPVPEPFRGQVIVLVSAETAGPAEQFLEPLVFADRVVLIGDTTAGAGGLATEVDLGGGARLSVTIGQPVWENGRGASVGFAPRVYASPTSKALAAGKDVALQAALDFINERAN